MKTLVAYFSASDMTAKLAKTLAKAADTNATVDELKQWISTLVVQ